MLYFDRNGVSHGIDVNKSIALKKCDISLYWCFLNYSFKFQLNVCNRCRDLLMMPMNLSNTAISSIKHSNYRCISSLINKTETTKLMQNAELTGESRSF